MDRLLSKVGLHGKSFIPLLSSFACAIPGIMAARTIENRKDRLATILVAPFMSCSARLPVYTLLIGTFFAGYGAIAQAGIMLACYAIGIIAAVLTAWCFKRTFLKTSGASFILEMPTYKIPQLSQVARQVWSNSKAFIVKAGTTIFCFSVVLWAMNYYPRLPAAKEQPIRAAAMAKSIEDQLNSKPWDALPPRRRPGETDDQRIAELQQFFPDHDAVVVRQKQDADNAVAAAQSEYSFAGHLGHAIEPVLRPLGFDWKMDVGLVAAFAARETFVSTMGITYAVGQADDGQTNDLAAAMRRDVYRNGPRQGHAVWTPLVAVSVLVWFVLALQCMSTLSITRRETGGWGWPIFMLLYMNGLAYVVSLVIFQVGSLIWRQ
jgi:ferrous iron transport protein B